MKENTVIHTLCCYSRQGHFKYVSEFVDLTLYFFFLSLGIAGNRSLSNAVLLLPLFMCLCSWVCESQSGYFKSLLFFKLYFSFRLFPCFVPDFLKLNSSGTVTMVRVDYSNYWALRSNFGPT